MLQAEQPELADIFLNVDPGNTANTPEMENFTDFESCIVVKAKRARIMFYTKDFTEEETKKIHEFKQLCQKNGHKIPESDEEILRFLVNRRMNPKMAYDAIM